MLYNQINKIYKNYNYLNGLIGPSTPPGGIGTPINSCVLALRDLYYIQGEGTHANQEKQKKHTKN